jgi:hypothetical protein
MDGRRFPLLPLALLLAVLVALGTAGAPVARADDSPATRWPAGGSTLRLAMGMATEHWGMSPCRGRVALSWAGLGAGTNAQSSWANDVDPFARPSANSDCEIAFSLQAGWDWPKLCTVVLHEVGHLTGHDHVADPDDLMYLAYVAPAPECASTPEPVETGPPPPAQATVAAPDAPARKATPRATQAASPKKAAKRKKIPARRPGRRPAHR